MGEHTCDAGAPVGHTPCPGCEEFRRKETEEFRRAEHERALEAAVVEAAMALYEHEANEPMPTPAWWSKKRIDLRLAQDDACAVLRAFRAAKGAT